METIVYPKPPSQTAVNSLEELNGVLEELSRYNRGVARYNDDLYNILHSGYLVRSFRVESLEAGKIGAGTITTNQLFLGSQNFTLDGVLSQMRVQDAQNPPVTRVEIGAFGSGSDYGIKVRDAAGTLVFQAASTTFINGAVITNATISNAKITDVDGNKIHNGTIGDSKIANLSAGKITAGTLIVDGSPAIQVTSSGAMVFTNGGDIIMRAATNDFNFISWRTSGNAERANVAYNSSNNQFTIQSVGGAAMRILSSSTLLLGSGTTPVTIGGRLGGSIIPAFTNSSNLGSSTLRFANVWSVLINGADYCYENGYRMTEANHVWSWMKPEDGWVLLNHEWKPILFIDRAGNATFAGKVAYGNLPEPDVKRREPQGENDARNRDALN